MRLKRRVKSQKIVWIKYMHGVDKQLKKNLRSKKDQSIYKNHERNILVRVEIKSKG